MFCYLVELLPTIKPSQWYVKQKHAIAYFANLLPCAEYWRSGQAACQQKKLDTAANVLYNVRVTHRKLTTIAT
jgi:hypothetical protein